MGTNVLAQMATGQQDFGVSASRYLPYLDSAFQAQSSDGEIKTLQLVKVLEHRRAANQRQGVGGECYSLIFTAAEGAQLSPSIYRLQHPALGERELFLTPFGFEGVKYEALINNQYRL